MQKDCVHKDYPCYVGWRDTGEASVIVIPLGDKLNDKQLAELLEPLGVVSFSEETADFTIQELDKGGDD